MNTTQNIYKMTSPFPGGNEITYYKNFNRYSIILTLCSEKCVNVEHYCYYKLQLQLQGRLENTKTWEINIWQQHKNVAFNFYATVRNISHRLMNLISVIFSSNIGSYCTCCLKLLLFLELFSFIYLFLVIFY